MSVLNRALLIILQNAVLLVITALIYVFYNIVVDGLFLAVELHPVATFKWTEIPGNMLYFLLGYASVLPTILLLAILGNLMFFINLFIRKKSFSLFQSGIIFGALFLLVPIVTKVIFHSEYYQELGEYSGPYRMLKFHLIFFMLGVSYGYLYWRIMKRYDTLLFHHQDK